MVRLRPAMATAKPLGADGENLPDRHGGQRELQESTRRKHVHSCCSCAATNAGTDHFGTDETAGTSRMRKWLF